MDKILDMKHSSFQNVCVWNLSIDPRHKHSRVTKTYTYLTDVTHDGCRLEPLNFFTAEAQRENSMTNEALLCFSSVSPRLRGKYLYLRDMPFRSVQFFVLHGLEAQWSRYRESCSIVGQLLILIALFPKR